MRDPPINLNKVRKARVRAAQKAQADQNVVTYGLSKDSKTRAKQDISRMARDLDGKAIDTPPYGSEDGKD